MLPATPTTTAGFPSGIRVQLGSLPTSPVAGPGTPGMGPSGAGGGSGGGSGGGGGGRKPPPSSLGTLPTFAESVATTPRGGSFTGFGPPSPGLHPVFAKRKRSVFKGPSAGLGFAGGLGGGLAGSPRNRSLSVESRVRDRRRSAIVEEDEDEEGLDLEGDEDVEEVEVFSPVEEGTVVVTEGGEISPRKGFLEEVAEGKAE